MQLSIELTHWWGPQERGSDGSGEHGSWGHAILILCWDRTHTRHAHTRMHALLQARTLAYTIHRVEQ